MSDLPLVEYQDTWPSQFLPVARELRCVVGSPGAIVVGGTLWRQHLQFRDQLRHDAQLRQSYAALKRRLAVLHAADRAACTEAKAPPFIQQVLPSPPPSATSARGGAA